MRVKKRNEKKIGIYILIDDMVCQEARYLAKLSLEEYKLFFGVSDFYILNNENEKLKNLEIL